jgi:hypothetical protein
MDRVSVENTLRPQYADYINLNMSGVQGNIYGNATSWEDAGSANAWQKSRNNITGQYGNQWSSTNYQTCGLNSYEKAMAQTQQANRGAAYANNAYMARAFKQASGNGNGNGCR